MKSTKLIKLVLIVQLIFSATLLTSCNHDAEYRGEVEQAIGDGEYTEARKCAANIEDYSYRNEAYEKINRSQIAFLINSENVDQAYNLSQEENCAFIFFETFMPSLIDVYNSVGKNKVLQYMSKVELGVTPNLEGAAYEAKEYNDVVNKHNILIEQFMSYLKVSGDEVFASQLLNFIKPILVGDWHEYELSYKPQEDIKTRLGL